MYPNPPPSCPLLPPQLMEKGSHCPRTCHWTTWLPGVCRQAGCCTITASGLIHWFFLPQNNTVTEVCNSSNVFSGEEQMIAFTVREPIVRGTTQHNIIMVCSKYSYRLICTQYCSPLLSMCRDICSTYDKGICSQVSVLLKDLVYHHHLLSCLSLGSQYALLAGMPASWWTDSFIMTFHGESIFCVPCMLKMC